MANSSRPAAPRSAIAGSATPALSHRPLMSLEDIRETLQSVEGSLDALLVLLRAGSGAKINTDHVEALLAPVHRQLEAAANDLIDLPLTEQPASPPPVLDTQWPDRTTFIVKTFDDSDLPGAVVTGYYFNRTGDGLMHAFGRYDGGYFLIDEGGPDVFGNFDSMSSLLDRKMGGAA